ncbi:MAG: hypothetical protein KJO30_11590 [Boseongicola sp.]|nr:hypothetical protein [Boseongicola sp.]NNJ69305.1 hypothetical protein [Boseongicola sp.]
MILRCLILLFLPLMLAACGGPAEPVWAPDAAVKRAFYAHSGPPRVTLYTVVSTRNGSGGHSGLMINGAERVMFDPAGTFQVPFVPERNDVLFGMTGRALAAYVDYHARPAWDVRVQEVDVSEAQAAALLAAVKAYGAVPKAQCSLAIGRILSRVEGFKSVGVGYFPNALAGDFGALPGVRERSVTDKTADTNHNVIFKPRP